MAITISRENISKKDGSVELIKYDNITELDTDPPWIEMTEWADKSVQLVGTFNGGTVVIEGSNDGVTPITLTDPQGNAISKTSGFIEQILEVTRFVRPRVTAGTGVDLDAFFVVRRTQGLRS